MSFLSAESEYSQHRKVNVTSYAMLLLAASVAFEAAATGMLLAQGGNIWDQSVFRMCCLIGATGGAILSVFTWPDSKDSSQKGLRAMASKMLCSAIGGWAFTPPVMRYLNLPLDVDMVVAASCCVAFLSVATLQTIAATYRWAFAKWLESKVGSIVGSRDEAPPSPPGK